MTQEILFRLVTTAGEHFILAKDEENALKRAHLGAGIPLNMIIKVEVADKKKTSCV